MFNKKRKSDQDLDTLKGLIERFHATIVGQMLEEYTKTGSVSQHYVDFEIMYTTFRSQEKLNKITNVLVIFTVALVILTIVLVYFTYRLSL
ncbi:MAG: hypothetical protein FJ150_03555 [Euryarchaeota archaeon]|nr:hypothetical protein [Euryarchaeota archaeon]